MLKAISPTKSLHCLGWCRSVTPRRQHESIDQDPQRHRPNPQPGCELQDAHVMTRNGLSSSNSNWLGVEHLSGVE